MHLSTKICIFWLLIFIAAETGFPGFSSDMEKIALDMAKNLNLSPDRSLSLTVIEEDASYMLPMTPIYRRLKEGLAPYAKEVRFNGFRGEEDALIRSMIISGGDLYAPLGMNERRIDSLILTGSYFITNARSDRVNFSLKAINIRGQRLFDSGEYTILKKECPPAIDRIIFCALNDKEAAGEIQYRGKIIGKLDRLFNSANSNLLVQPAVYRFEKRDPYAVQWQVDALKSVLTVKYGICFSDSGCNSIILEPTGTLVFVKDGRQRHTNRVVDGEPLLVGSYPEAYDSMNYIYSSDRESAEKPAVETKRFTTREEKSVRDRIYETFDRYYPALFNNFNPAKLEDLFVDRGRPSILVGRKMVSDPETGREIIRYAWHTPESWISGLKTAHDSRGRTFDVTTSVMRIFADNLEPSRYWAVVLQRWKTLDIYNKAVYEDNGFLIVNFDFDADVRLKDFKIHYRLWFCDYQYDDLELGIRRHEKLTNDINNLFVNGMSGIDKNLKIAMRDFLISRVKGVRSGGFDL